MVWVKISTLLKSVVKVMIGDDCDHAKSCSMFASIPLLLICVFKKSGKVSLSNKSKI